MKSNKISLKVMKDEYWWGGAVSYGVIMPFGRENVEVNLAPNNTPNQAAPFLVSSKGRYIWCDEPINFKFENDNLYVESIRGEIELREGFENLRHAYVEAQKQHFPAKGKHPDELLFTAPQYNTWIELMYEQEESRILEYAESIVNNGMPAGVLMIDDNWQEDYGSWKFHPGRFKNAKAMIEKIHGLGFKVMLWVCPYVSPDSAVFRFLEKEGCLVRDSNGNTAIRKWWNGYSALLDLTNNKTVKWFKDQLDILMDEYGVDGFKFDGGDPDIYRASDIASISNYPNDFCRYYAEFGKQFKLNEFRACWKEAGEPIAQRLCDKEHSWGKNGLASLIPNALAQGLLGYAFTCPDMIGGGEYLNFMENSSNLDQELFVRYAQCSALFPMMQFSAAPWRVLSEENLQHCKNAAELHLKFGQKILDLAKSSAKTGEPIIRHLAYAFPDCGFEHIDDEFMLGDDVLVAPLIIKGQRRRKIVFPEGVWIGDDGSRVNGNCELIVEVPLCRIPWYVRQQ